MLGLFGRPTHYLSPRPENAFLEGGGPHLQRFAQRSRYHDGNEPPGPAARAAEGRTSPRKSTPSALGTAVLLDRVQQVGEENSS